MQNMTPETVSSGPLKEPRSGWRLECRWSQERTIPPNVVSGAAISHYKIGEKLGGGGLGHSAPAPDIYGATTGTTGPSGVDLPYTVRTTCWLPGCAPAGTRIASW